MGSEMQGKGTFRCPRCGKEIMDVAGSRFCQQCGAELHVEQAPAGFAQPFAAGTAPGPVPESPKKSKKPLLIGLLAAVILIGGTVGVLFATHVLCFHKWEAATCISPKTCTVCGKTSGEVAGHDWEPATCQAPETCSVCGKTRGEALDHEYGSWRIMTEATWTTPGKQERTCELCGNIETGEIQPYLRPANVMIEQFDEEAKAHLPGYIRTDYSGSTYFSVCGTGDEDYIQISFLDANGNLISGSQVPSRIVLLEVLERGENAEWNTDLILNTATALLNSIKGGEGSEAGYTSIWNQLVDINEQASGTFDVGETKQSSGTVCGATVKEAAMWDGSKVVITVTIEP